MITARAAPNLRNSLFNPRRECSAQITFVGAEWVNFSPFGNWNTAPNVSRLAPGSSDV
jgi:hypothetical protein